MKSSSKISTLVGAVALALAVAGFALSNVSAQTKPTDDKVGQGVASVSLGF